MAKEQLAVAEMVFNIILGKTEKVSRVDFLPQKGRFPDQEKQQQAFERATPESQGIDSERLSAMVKELEASPLTDMHHLMVLRNKKVICECHFAPYRENMWHVTHSMCKSITGMAIGMLIEEGKLSLNENIYDIFSEKVNRATLLKPLSWLPKPAVTVENLLTMTSAVSFNESGAVSGNDWLDGYLNASQTGKPGTQFQYNSMNTYVLSAIVTQRTGMTLEEYLRPRLFEHMGITRYLWETCPRGITKGGWGLYLCPEDMAKLGQLYLQKGVWNGVQLVPESWVEASTQKRLDSGEGTFGYGYQLWMEGRPGSFEFNGMLGQNVVVYPDMNMVIVTCAGNNELFQDCIMLNIIRRYFPLEYQPSGELPENQTAFGMLQRLTGELGNGSGNLPVIGKGGWSRALAPGRRSRRQQGWSRKKKMLPQEDGFEQFRDTLDGKTYELERQSVGILPLMMQVFHNNMTEGIRRVGFFRNRGVFTLYLLEGTEWIAIPVGFGHALESWITVRAESYLVAAGGTFCLDEYQDPVLKLEFSYLEEASRRRLHIHFRNQGEQIELHWFETPGKKLIMEGLGSVTDALTGSHLLSALKGREGVDLLHRLMEEAIEPMVRGNRC